MRILVGYFVSSSLDNWCQLTSHTCQKCGVSEGFVGYKWIKGNLFKLLFLKYLF